MKNISSGVTFTGKSTFEGNTPVEVNGTKITSEANSAGAPFQEDHPFITKPDAAAQTPSKVAIKANPKDGKVVTIPLMGHRFDFATNTIRENKDPGKADVIFHIDPLMAIGDAGLKVLSPTDLKAGDSLAKLSNAKYDASLWGVKTGDTIAVKTNSGRFVVMKILNQEKDNYTIQYRFVK